MQDSFHHVAGTPRPPLAPPPDPEQQRLEALQRELRELDEDCEMYRGHLDLLRAELTGEADVRGPDLERVQLQLRNEEELLQQELGETRQEKEKLESEVEALKSDAAELDRAVLHYWHEFNAFTVQRTGLEAERDVMLGTVGRLSKCEAELRQTNVYNDCFYIWHDGHFGTINGFRLGRLPDQLVPWDEINAAWGQVVLLLDTMAKQKNFEFTGRQLQPQGSFSKLIEEGSTLEFQGGVSFFGSFDRAMVAFLQCLREFGDFAERSDRTLRLPYHIEKDKIGVLGKPDKWFPIKRRFESDENWTNGLKYMLTNLKWLVAWLCRDQHRQ